MAACAALACKHDGLLGFPSLKRCALQGLRILFPALVVPHPSGWAEERSRKRIRASDCLSRRRVRARPRFRRAPQVAPERSAGDPDHRVAFSLVTFFWRSKRKLLAAGQPRLAGTPHCTSKSTWIPDPVRDDNLLQGFLDCRRQRQWHDFNALFNQLHRLLHTRLPANVAVLSVSVVHGACLVGKTLAHVFGISQHVA